MRWRLMGMAGEGEGFKEFAKFSLLLLLQVKLRVL